MEALLTLLNWSQLSSKRWLPSGPQERSVCDRSQQPQEGPLSGRPYSCLLRWELREDEPGLAELGGPLRTRGATNKGLFGQSCKTVPTGIGPHARLIALGP